MKSSAFPIVHLLAILLVVSGCEQPGSRDQNTIVLHDVTVIDGTGAEAKPHQAIVLRGERITFVGPIDSVDIPTDAEVLDLSGQYVIPGFVDLHVHFPEDTTVHQAMLNRLLEFGVTTILNPGARPGAGVELRDQIRSGTMRGPQMFTAGRLIDGPPDEFRNAEWVARPLTADEIRTEIRLQAEQGVDFIKLYAGLPPELVDVAIEESRALNLPVIGHLEATTWGTAAHMGIDMLVHSGWATPMDEIVNLDDPDAATESEWYHAYADAPNGERFANLVATLVEHQVIVVPTLSLMQVSGIGKDASMLIPLQPELAPEADVPGWWGEGWREQHPYYGYESVEEAQLMDSLYTPALLGIMRAYYERGVRLGVGTDVGNAWMTPGVSFHRELELYQEAGIPPLEILKMASHNGAEALGILSDTGTIEAGKRANLLVLSSDPGIDIRNTRDIDYVFLRWAAR